MGLYDELFYGVLQLNLVSSLLFILLHHPLSFFILLYPPPPLPPHLPPSCFVFFLLPTPPSSMFSLICFIQFSAPSFIYLPFPSPFLDHP